MGARCPAFIQHKMLINARAGYHLDRCCSYFVFPYSFFFFPFGCSFNLIPRYPAHFQTPRVHCIWTVWHNEISRSKWIYMWKPILITCFAYSCSFVHFFLEICYNFICLLCALAFFFLFLLLSLGSFSGGIGLNIIYSFVRCCCCCFFL